MKMKPCTEAELLAFVEAYPRELRRDVARICDPPYESFNDYTLGNWPDCVVASASLEDERTDPERAKAKGWYRESCKILDMSAITIR